MKKHLLTILLIIFATAIYGQTTQESDFDWQVETEFEYQLENDSLLNFEYKSPMDSIAGSSEVKTVKIDLKQYYSYPNLVLRSFLIKSAEKGIFPAYTIAGNKKIPPKEIGRILSFTDSIIIIDRETGEQRVSYFLDAFDIAYVESLIIKQGWYYQQKNNQLYTKVIDVVPVVNRKGKRKKLFRIAMNNSIIKEEIEFNDPNYSWIKFSRSFVTFKDAKIIKGESTKEFEEQLLDQAKSGLLACFEPYSSLYYKERIPEKVLDVMVNPSVDTLISFDPNTNIETIQPIESFGIDSEDIVGIKANQYWYIDPIKNTLDVQLVTIDLVVKDRKPRRKDLNIKLPFRVYFY